MSSRPLLAALIPFALTCCVSVSEPIGGADAASPGAGDGAKGDVEDVVVDSGPRACTTDDECGSAFCVRGTCRSRQCEGDEDCADRGPLWRCDEEAGRCVECAADDRRCLEVECAAALHCQDFEHCTEDLCVDYECEHRPIEGCCSKDDECSDGVDCTIDRCQVGRCTFTRRDNFCCLDDEDCDDRDDCTADRCRDHSCLHPRGDGPECACQVDLECEDHDPCTGQACVEGRCTYTASGAAGCCEVGRDCDDGDEATFEDCEDGRCVAADSPECGAGAECASSNACLAGSCVLGHCHFEPRSTQGCCDALSDCPEAALCQRAGCAEFSCTVETVTGPFAVWEEGFDGEEGLDALGWEVEPDGSGAAWRRTTALSVSHPGSLYYGTPDAGGFDVGVTAGNVTSPPLTVPAGRSATLSFMIATDTEPGFERDVVAVDLLTAGGPVQIFAKDELLGSTQLAWRSIQIALPEGADGARLRFAFDSVDEKLNDGRGVFVDDVQVTVDCP